ncbi:hypothetical protein AWZ03_003463 [Drosophila navojoa]|uniref:EF-hand domain-containing protein n=1 Tax=Drosophila navojoa TaxID=7232 RepID=A0A484BN77_DRONA|nr:uncharacterized protein LOC108654887 [Drosophila navojoa]TDG50247.1 hypothetical protein AWZ03_003463 [Drosophila navojoa]
MNHSAVLIISCLLLWSNARAAFKDFVVEPGDEQFESKNDLGLGCAAEESEHLISFQDVEQDGVIDTQLLLSALVQHAQRLGVSLDQLANQAQTIEADDLLEAELGCGSAGSLSYREQPSWYDVFFS